MSAQLERGKVVVQESKPYLGDTIRLCNLNRQNWPSWPERGNMVHIPWSESDPEIYYPTEMIGVFYFRNSTMQFLIDNGVRLVDGMKEYNDADVFIIGDSRHEHDEALFPRLEHPGFTLDEAKVWFKEQRQAFEQTGVD
eukprot:1401163-Rhodomonas_salina.1